MTSQAPGNTAPRFPEMVEALFGVFALYWRIDERIDGVNISPPLSRGERHLLMALEHPKRMGDLAREMHALPSTVTANADQLEAKSLAERVRDPQDRRAWLLHLTPAGTDARDLLARKSGELFAQATGLSPEETRQLAVLMGKVRQHIHETGFPEGLKKCSSD